MQKNKFCVDTCTVVNLCDYIVFDIMNNENPKNNLRYEGGDAHKTVKNYMSLKKNRDYVFCQLKKDGTIIRIVNHLQDEIQKNMNDVLKILTNKDEGIIKCCEDNQLLCKEYLPNFLNFKSEIEVFDEKLRSDDKTYEQMLGKSFLNVHNNALLYYLILNKKMDDIVKKSIEKNGFVSLYKIKLLQKNLSSFAYCLERIADSVLFLDVIQNKHNFIITPMVKEECTYRDDEGRMKSYIDVVLGFFDKTNTNFEDNSHGDLLSLSSVYGGAFEKLKMPTQKIKQLLHAIRERQKEKHLVPMKNDLNKRNKLGDQTIMAEATFCEYFLITHNNKDFIGSVKVPVEDKLDNRIREYIGACNENLYESKVTAISAVEYAFDHSRQSLSAIRNNKNNSEKSFMKKLFG